MKKNLEETSMNNLPSAPSPFLLYTAPDGKVKVDVFVQDETVWLTQKAMAELFGVKTPAISKHLANIFVTANLKKKQLFPFWKQLKQHREPRS
jgi:hypothetical protein